MLDENRRNYNASRSKKFGTHNLENPSVGRVLLKTVTTRASLVSLHLYWSWVLDSLCVFRLFLISLRSVVIFSLALPLELGIRGWFVIVRSGSVLFYLFSLPAFKTFVDDSPPTFLFSIYDGETSTCVESFFICILFDRVTGSSTWTAIQVGLVLVSVFWIDVSTDSSDFELEWFASHNLLCRQYLVV